MVDTASSIWRDFVTDGVPSSGKNKPKKSKVREWGTAVEEGIKKATPLDIGNEYTGIVATGAKVPTQFNPANKWLMAVSRHVARDNVNGLRLAFANWYVDSVAGVETPTGSTMSLRVSIEYPKGRMRRVSFSGSDTALVASGSTMWSSWIDDLNIREGDTFFIRTYVENAAGVIYNIHAPGYLEAGATVDAATNDKTSGGGGTTISANNYNYVPSAIVGKTRKSSVVILGDSIAEGFNDVTSFNDSPGGFLSRGLEEALGVLSMAKSSDDTAQWLAGHSRRADFIQYASHLVIEYGINDIRRGRSAATLKANIETIIAAYGKPTFVCTITPQTTSTDGWMTTANQTIHATDAQRTAYNDIVRAGSIAGQTGYFEIADALETARNSGYWKTVLNADTYILGAATDDGLHPLPSGHKHVVRVGAVNHRNIQKYNEISPRQSTDYSTHSLNNTSTFITPAQLRKELGYDRGVFVPRVIGETSAGTCTYTTQVATYNRIGNLVYFLILLNWTGHTGTGRLRIADMPFANQVSGCPAGSITHDGITYSAGITLAPWLPTASDFLNVKLMATGISAAYLAIQAAGSLQIAGTYMAAPDARNGW